MNRRKESRGEVTRMTIVIMTAMVDLLRMGEEMDTPEVALGERMIDSGVE